MGIGGRRRGFVRIRIRGDDGVEIGNCSAMITPLGLMLYALSAERSSTRAASRLATSPQVKISPPL